MNLRSRGNCWFRPGVLTTGMGTLLFYLWGLMLIVFPQNTTSVYGVLSLLKGAAGISFLAAAFLSSIPLFFPFKTPIINAVLMFPQQFLLCLCSYGVVSCIVASQFADGIIHPRAFIFVDQIWIVAFSYFHAIAVVAMSDNLPRAF